MVDKRIYWDACVWIGLINQEADKIAACEYAIGLAEAATIEIWTSTLSLAEVFKKKCDGAQVGIQEASDQPFENFLSQDYVVRVQVDADVGLLARRLLRKYAQLAKPADAIHLATALLNNLDEFHTFDGENLLALNGVIERMDGVPLKICNPPNPPPVQIGPLFDEIPDNAGGQNAGAA